MYHTPNDTCYVIWTDHKNGRSWTEAGAAFCMSGQTAHKAVNAWLARVAHDASEKNRIEAAGGVVVMRNMRGDIVWTDEVDNLIRSQYEAGASLKKIGGMIGVNDSTAGVRAREIGVTIRHRVAGARRSRSCSALELMGRSPHPLPAMSQVTWGLLTSHAPDLYHNVNPNFHFASHREPWE